LLLAVFGFVGVVCWIMGGILAWLGRILAEDVKGAVESLTGVSIPEGDQGEAAASLQIEDFQQVFEPDGVYAGIPYKTLPTGRVEAMLHGGLVRFRSMEQFTAATSGRQSQPAASENIPVLQASS
jgi:hypothetical protein